MKNTIIFSLQGYLALFLQFQSLLDFCASVILLSSSLTVTDHYFVQDDGTVGWMQCHIWNNKFLLWAFFGCSTLEYCFINNWKVITLQQKRVFFQL